MSPHSKKQGRGSRVRARAGFEIRTFIAGRFESRILIDPAAEFGPPLETLSGRWSVRDGLALTAIVI